MMRPLRTLKTWEIGILYGLHHKSLTQQAGHKQRL